MPEQYGIRGRREPTVGDSLAASSAGMSASPQEEQFLVNLGLGALRSAYDASSQRQGRTPGMQPPPRTERMQQFQRTMGTPRYQAPGQKATRPRPTLGQRRMNVQGQQGMGQRRPMMQRPMMQPMMQQPMMQPMMQYPQQFMAPQAPAPPMGYAGFGMQSPQPGYYGPQMF